MVSSPTHCISSSALSCSRIVHSDSTSSYTSGPASNLSLYVSWEAQDGEDQIGFYSYDGRGYYGQIEDLELSVSPRVGGPCMASPPPSCTSSNVSRPESPDPAEHAEDDTAVRSQPPRHIDYLSHNWEEEDIWSSWKHILSKGNAYSNGARLENALWRTWAKLKHELQTVSPESVNWLKDCDITWLYGPLQTRSDTLLRVPSSSPASSSRISTSKSFLNQKQILKKQSMSETMLQMSLSASSLVKQAAAEVQAQQLREVGRSAGLATSDCVTFPSFSRLAYPSTEEEKHIRFDEQVKQCIALEMKSDGDEESDSYGIHDYDNSDSDDEAVMIDKSNPK